MFVPRPPFTLDLPNASLDLGARPHLMGILNVTPDSFSDGGRYETPAAAVDRAKAMLDEGADIIDVGGESTRPAGPYGEGARPVDLDEEIRRTAPVVEAVANLGAVVSIDTMKPGVARAAVEAGASIINDVSAARFDPDMADVVVETGAHIVLMHMQGTPKTMQKSPRYDDVVSEVAMFLEARVKALIDAGAAPKRILVDPGFGFGKRERHNLELVSGLAQFHDLGKPILVGVSRKGFTGPDLDPGDRLEGSLAVLALCAERGGHVFRVHDVAESRRVLDVVTRAENCAETARIRP